MSSPRVSPLGWSSPWLVFGLVFIWKLALLIFTAQPVPSNDSFFYDGAVVNLLLHGHYCNPSIALVFPISGNEVFSGYPPLYQAVLLGWMKVAGTTTLAAMWLHLILFGGYLLALLGTLRRLELPSWCINLAGLFLLAITFHDRPDSLAHLLGMLAIYAWVRFVKMPTPAMKWAWISVSLAVLTLATSLQIGAIYCLWIWLLSFALTMADWRRFPVAPLLALLVVPAVLVALVKTKFPHLWTGFMEHVSLTPSVSGFGLPAKESLLKIGRTVPGVLLVALFLVPRAKSIWEQIRSGAASLANQLLWLGTLCCLALVIGCLFVVTPNMISIGAYLQPLIVACFLAGYASEASWLRMSGRIKFAVIILASLAAIRAVGMSTWGVACAKDVGYSSALKIVNAELDQSQKETTVAVSAAFLYEAARHQDLVIRHSDWLSKPIRGQPDDIVGALKSAKPARLVLTQFDYYRRFEAALSELATHPELVGVTIQNAAHTPAPDASKTWQRVIQHVSWAPVIVRLEWK